jgi:uncharacterized protein (DUF1684 family)
MTLWIAALALLLPAAKTGSYVSEVEKWRQQREERLKAEDGWLTLTGLYWLRPGENKVGSDPSSGVLLPAGKAPAKVAVISLSNGKATLKVENGVPLLVNGKPVKQTELKSDAGGASPDMMTIGDLRFYIIHRSGKDAIRLKDKNSEYRVGFQGLKWYPVSEKWKITAKWVAYPTPRKRLIDTMIGEKEEELAPGYAEFKVNGAEYKLEPTTEDGELFFVFRDKTAGKTTYPAARFLKAAMPANGTVVLDFNKAYNPPCVFTPYATCPLPLPQNRLPFALEAGELMYKSKEYDASRH